MIQPIQLDSMLNFKGMSPSLKNRTEAGKSVSKPQAEVQSVLENKEAEVQEAPKKKFSVKETYRNAKKSVVGFFKGVNNVTNVTSGAAKGVVEGGIIAAAIGVVGKNIKSADGKILGALTGLGTDLWNAAKAVLKVIPKVITKSPLENIKSLGKSAQKGAKVVWRGIKDNRSTAAIAIVAGLAVFALKTIQGKVQANKQNADLDHKTNLGHV